MKLKAIEQAVENKSLHMEVIVNHKVCFPALFLCLN